MDARTRERLPVLPVLIRTVDQRRKTPPPSWQPPAARPSGQSFTAAGQTLTRSATTTRPRIQEDLGQRAGHRQRRDLIQEEDPPSGPGQSSKSCAPPGSASKSSSNSPTTALSSTGCPPPGTGPAAADRAVQDRRRTAPARQPRTRRRAQRHHLPDPRLPPAPCPLVRAYDSHECSSGPRPPAPVPAPATAPSTAGHQRLHALRLAPRRCSGLHRARPTPPPAPRCAAPRTTSAGCSSLTRS